MLPIKVLVPPEVKTFEEHLKFWRREADGMTAEYNGWRDAALRVTRREAFTDEHCRARYDEGYRNATEKLKEEMR